MTRSYRGAGTIRWGAQDGKNGLPGQIPIQKEWVVGDVHRNTDEIVDYIYVRGADKNTSYWYKLASKGTKPDVGAPPSHGTTPPGYERIDWLKELAVSVLLAEEANVAGFIFKEGQLISVRGTVDGVDVDYSGQANFVPNLILHGAEGDVKITGTVNAESGSIGGFLIEGEKLMASNAGLSGVEGDKKEDPAFWGGGSYQEAINFQEALQAIKDGNIPPDKDYANFIVNHDGSSRLGSFMISETGDYVLLDPITKKPAIIFGETHIPPVSVLVSGLGSEIVVSNVAKTNITGGQIYKLPNFITTLIPGKKIRFMGKITVTATVDEGKRYGHRVSLIKEPYRYWRTFSIDRRKATGPGRKTYTYTEDIDVTFDNIQEGTYSVNVEIAKSEEDYPATTDISINIGESSLRVFTDSSSLNRIQIGPNGLMGWHGNKFMHFTIEEGFQTSNAETLRYGTVGYNGELKDGSYGNLPNVTKLATGQYKIFHMIGSDKYNLMVTAKVTPSGNVLSAGYTEKDANYIIIEAKNHQGEAEEAEIDFIITRSLI